MTECIFCNDGPSTHECEAFQSFRTQLQEIIDEVPGVGITIGTCVDCGQPAGPGMLIHCVPCMAASIVDENRVIEDLPNE